MIHISLQKFNQLVDKMLEAKQRNQDTADLERQIDLMVYKLYDLTEEEIKIVDPEFELIEKENIKLHE